MGDLLYSLNATVPVFLVMVLGWWLRRRGMLTGEFVAVANTFNFNVALPVLLFCDISAMDIGAIFNGRFFAFCVVVTVVCFGAIWLGARRFLKDKTLVGSFVQGSFRGSAAVLGVAFIVNIYGDAGYAPLMIMASVPLYNVLSVVVLTFEGQGMKGSLGSKLKRAGLDVVRNPLIIGILLGVVWALLPLSMPQIAAKTLSSVGDLATPLALVAIGAGFEGKSAWARLGPAMAGSLIKLVVQPAVFLPAALLLGFRNQELMALLILLGAPTTPSTYIMAKNMGNDGPLATSLIVATTLLSALTVTGWIYLLRVLHAV